MIRVSPDNPILDRLTEGANEVTFNLFYRIRGAETPMLLTDGRTCIAAQSNSGAPLWVFLNDEPAAPLADELASVLVSALEETPALTLVANPTLIRPVWRRITALIGRQPVADLPLNAYACFKLRERPAHGEMILPDESLCADIARLLCEHVEDATGAPVPAEDAERFARDAAHATHLFLWRDAGRVVAMANIAHTTDRYARINTVVTAREERCKGYAGMLVGRMCAELRRSGLIPMLYADARNPASNAAYRHIGFELQGEVTEYSFPQEERK